MSGTASDPVTRAGGSPLVLSFPHVGTDLPDGVAAGLSDAGRALPDTDWHVDQLYDDMADDLDATVLTARWSRYVVDLNRDPSGASLYPGRTTTEICPASTFDGSPIHLPGRAPDPAEIARRITAYFEPYHTALDGALTRAVERHGFALLWDAHSIRSEIPRLFDGTLPELNVGTNDGRSCAPDLRQTAAILAKTASPYDYTVDGRFKGGWITRRYGRPAVHVHAVQLELAQRAYMDEAPPGGVRDDLAAELHPVLRRLVVDLLGVARRLYHGATR